jgi:hypothetical protein
MSTIIRILLLDDQPTKALAVIEDHLRDQLKVGNDAFTHVADGFTCVIAARGQVPEILLSMEANAHDVKKPDLALAWAKTRLNACNYNGVLIDDSWNHDSDDRSGHQVILVGLSQFAALRDVPGLQFAVFSHHLESDAREPRQVAVASKIETALPSWMKGRTTPIPKSEPVAFRNWFNLLVQSRPQEVVPIEIRGDYDIYIADESEKFTAGKCKHVVLAYLILVCEGRADAKPQEIAEIIRNDYRHVADGQASGSLSHKMGRLFRSPDLEKKWKCTNTDVSAAVDEIKKAIRKYLPDARRGELDAIGRGAGSHQNNTRLLRTFISVTNLVTKT